MRAGRIVATVIGSLVVLVAAVVLAAGATLIWASQTQRDAAGYYHTPAEPLRSAGYALTARVDFGTSPSGGDWVPVHPLGTVRIEATGLAGRELFVGIAPTSAVDAWLAGVPHDRVTSISYGPFETRYEVVLGSRAPSSPGQQSFWVKSSSGSGTRTLLWPSRAGHWTAVLMNADGTPGVAAAVSLGTNTGLLLPIGAGTVGGGALILALGTVLLVFGLRRKPTPAPAAEAWAGAEAVGAGAGAGAGAAYPLRLSAGLDGTAGRWLWLVKWLLVLPHVVVLAVLWLAAGVLTAVAGVAILVTGRYPRPIFEFVEGVMRWTWRVSFYAIGAFGTDRYPPFSLAPDPDYPADLSIDYPEHLSRGLVLVKWWLLAIPQYLVVGILAGGFGFGTSTTGSGGWRHAYDGGLIALLAVIAAATLLFTGRYPRQLFDLLVGLNRWCFRVLAYAALMRDEYPPFRLDTGGPDPGGRPVALPPPIAPEEAAGSADELAQPRSA